MWLTLWPKQKTLLISQFHSQLPCMALFYNLHKYYKSVQIKTFSPGTDVSVQTSQILISHARALYRKPPAIISPLDKEL